jgi:hypothetical protein
MEEICGIWLLCDMGKTYITCIFFLGFNVQGENICCTFMRLGVVCKCMDRS